jgi:hypothetical protein
MVVLADQEEGAVTRRANATPGASRNNTPVRISAAEQRPLHQGQEVREETATE